MSLTLGSIVASAINAYGINSMGESYLAGGSDLWTVMLQGVLYYAAAEIALNFFHKPAAGSSRSLFYGGGVRIGRTLLGGAFNGILIYMIGSSRGMRGLVGDNWLMLYLMGGLAYMFSSWIFDQIAGIGKVEEEAAKASKMMAADPYVYY